MVTGVRGVSFPPGTSRQRPDFSLTSLPVTASAGGDIDTPASNEIHAAHRIARRLILGVRKENVVGVDTPQTATLCMGTRKLEIIIRASAS
jgi:hypothetical protein